MAKKEEKAEVEPSNSVAEAAQTLIEAERHLGGEGRSRIVGRIISSLAAALADLGLLLQAQQAEEPEPVKVIGPLPWRQYQDAVERLPWTIVGDRSCQLVKERRNHQIVAVCHGGCDTGACTTHTTNVNRNGVTLLKTYCECS